MNPKDPMQSAAGPSLSRRDFLWQSGGGLGGIAMASLFNSQEQARANDGALAAVPKAKRVVQFFMAGAASHLDLFDFKPELVKHHGKPSDFGEPVEAFQNGLGPWLKPIWDFQPHGACGKLLGEPVSALGSVVDEIAFIHNMVSKSGVHSAATLLQATGFQLPGFPGAGCWVSYGLGSMNENLPAYVVMPDHRGYASNGLKNWDSAFLPAQHSGTVIYPGTETPIADLFPHKSGKFVSAEGEAEGRRVLDALNRRHALERAGDQRLDARIRSYELAARMQLAAPEALGLKDEPAHVLRLYGLEGGPQTWPKEINDLEETFYFSQRCLAARRLLERGVRFIQIYSGGNHNDSNWDAHGDLVKNHEYHAGNTDKPIAGLLKDLKQRGLLDETLVVWGGEFGRQPTAEYATGTGRDHNSAGFTMWMAGGGVKSGVSYGETDELGNRAVTHRTEVKELHSTILTLMGIDPNALSFFYGGLDQKLVGVEGAEPIRAILA